MSIDDFKTQYMLHFIDGMGKFLSKSEHESLRNGDHEWMIHGKMGELYVAGIDFAGASTETTDFTHISVVRVTPQGMKQKVFAAEFYGTEYNDQIREIVGIFGGVNPRFKCAKIFADYTGCGQPVVSVLKNTYGLPIHGIIFNASDTFFNSGMNLKNSMYAQFKSELNNDKFKYPTLDNFLNSTSILGLGDMKGFYHKMLTEWADLEMEVRLSINKIISAPRGLHDDVPSADILANFAAVTGSRGKVARPVLGRTRGY